MKPQAIQYWNTKAEASDAETRDAILCGFRSEKSFDEAGKVDVERLLLPFIKPRHTVLDIGCGIGRLLKWVAPRCERAIGMDISKGMLAKARRRLSSLPNVELAQLPPSLVFPLASASVDFAYFYHVSEHMEREDAYKILGEIRRTMKHNGVALVQFSLLDHQDNRGEFLRWAKAGDAEGVRSRFYTEHEVNLMLEMVGLHPQVRLYVPGEMVLAVTRRSQDTLGEMPLIRLPFPAPQAPRASQRRRKP
ncbi:MAG: class I SAM-dependent methyltransferase [Candidatus Solibacter usitatus]|nr:class I SAM-dependent methyltransferase [Candidatus Solibacter usitatus]